MLQIQHIYKEYHTGKFVQRALDDFSLNLRDNEFVAILGPSGSGKTTLLNIIGGLDHYDSGELIINGTSTKKYKDRDWDSYRNHTIGFVFQSYNLIPHQTLLSNVELALTISGVGRKERRNRARAALEKVGLGDQVNKRPNQLSGGQMQRVAIARALVNDPDILLADEPTGALDSATSLQVMDLLKEVAQDRLVVMVTHNPDLAEQYATRIVRVKDGQMVSDSDPYDVEEETLPQKTYGNMGKAFMSLPTAISLSFNNLLTKKARTLLTAFAGSIGIIGIALIMSLSTGVNDYIEDIEEETLSGYPLSIANSGMDMTALMEGSGLISLTGGEERDEDEINVISMITSMLSRVESNDLAALKEYLDSGESGVDPYVNAIEYSYDVTPQIYVEYEDGDYRQVNPDSSFSALGFGGSSSSMLSSFMSTDIFDELPVAENLYADQYEVVAGKWPENYNELILILSSSGSISDFMLYDLGLRDGAELDDMIRQFADGEDIETPDDVGTYTYEDIVGLTYHLVCAADYYEYDDQYEVWKDKTDNTEYMQQLVADSEELTIVGVAKPSPDATLSMLTSGVYYMPELIDHVTELAEESEIVQDQLEHPDTNILTGEEFGSEDEGDLFDLDSLFEIDEDALQDAFAFDEDELQERLSDSLDFSDLDLDLDFSDLDLDLDLDLSDLDLGSMDLGSMDLSGMDLSGMDLGSLDLGSMDFGSLDLGSLDLGSMDLSSMDLSSLDLSSLEDLDIDLPEMDMSELFSSLSFDLSDIDLTSLIEELIEGYLTYAEQNPSTDYEDLGTHFAEYLMTDRVQEYLLEEIEKIYSDSAGVTVATDQMESLVNQLLMSYMVYVAEGGDASDYMAFLNTADVQAIIQAWMTENITVDTSLLAVDAVQLQEMASTLAAGYERYARRNGYAQPSSIMDSFQTYLGTAEAESILTGALDLGDMETQMGTIMQEYMSTVMSAYTEALTQALTETISSQLTSSMSDMTSQMTSQLTSQLSSQLSSQMSSAVSSMTAGMTDQISSMMTEAMTSMMSQMTDAISESMSGALQDSLGDSLSDSLSESMSDSLSESMSDSLSESMSDSLSESMSDVMSDMMDIDSDTFMDAFEFNMDSDDMTELIVSMSTSTDSTYTGNLANFGYVDFDSPNEIDIYPIDFAGKDEIVYILDEYNDRMEAEGQEDKVITYSDTVGTLMSSVTDIINIISYVLIAFIAISLVVSSIMIGVITYISVLERQKEIGILRAIGASKGNISQVFNAETGIVGLCAGLLGVGVAMLLTIPGNALIHHLAGTTQVNMSLRPQFAGTLVVLSIVLTLIGGLIPSSKAAGSDPVVALRTD